MKDKRQLKTYILNIAKKAKAASIRLSSASEKSKNFLLFQMAKALCKHREFLLKENRKDLRKAETSGYSPAFIDRLQLTAKSISEISEGIKKISALCDPVGEVIKSWHRPNGLYIKKIRVPIGVILVIYESRPNVTADCAALCLKAGNAVILRGGRESFYSNLAIYKIINKTILNSGFILGTVSFITTLDREAVRELVSLSDYIDLVIPRGGYSLIKEVTEFSHIPVIKHYMGICHIYVDKRADLNMARNVCFNAKVQRPATCNAMETMLVHKDIAAGFLPEMCAMFKKAGVEIRGCRITKCLIPDIILAKDKDFHTEYLDLILSVKVVGGLDEAVRHITEYGSKHSDGIITKDKKLADEFVKRIDAACVYVNASTRFTDGFQFGMGAEMGISTDKIHARGPMGLEELTSYKYQVYGKGQIRT
ncbi:MAG: glutamate-5-semialdehyde dehydrogenase [Candidatus Omnitrophota bacterium]